MKFRQVLLVIFPSILLAACAQLAALNPTATPTITPTPTPAPEEILADGWTAFDNSDLDTAESIATQLLDSPDVETEATALLGLIALERKQYPQALTDLETAREGGYTDREIASLMFNTYLFLIKQNIDLLYQTYNFDTIQALTKETSSYYQNIIKLPQSSGVIPQSVIDLVDREMIVYFYTGFTGEANTLYEEGKTLYEQGAYQEALEKFDACSVLEPDNLELKFYLARSYRQLGQFDYAIELLNQILEVEPDSFLAYLWLAAMYSDLYLPQHTREAVINASFIANQHAASAEDLVEPLESFEQNMQPGLFNQYGFGLSLLPNFTVLESDGNTDSGAAFILDGSSSIVLIWGDPNSEPFNTAEDLEDWVGQLPEIYSLTGDIEPVGPPSIFLYNQEDIFVQQYKATFSISSEEILGLKAGWACGDTYFGITYITSQFTNSTNYTTENLYYYLYPLFESVTCGVPDATKIQGNADGWITNDVSINLQH